jgi:hypothetical protein
MHWTRFFLAVIVSGLGASITDWLFMGVLFHNKYLETPETWRGKPGQPEVANIVGSTAIGFVSCAAFIYLCYWTGALTVPHASLRMAVLAWLVAPLPLILTNALWIKMNPLLALSHSLGWLARFVVTALVAVWLLH